MSRHLCPADAAIPTCFPHQAQPPSRSATDLEHVHEEDERPVIVALTRPDGARSGAIGMLRSATPLDLPKHPTAHLVELRRGA